MMVFFYVKNWHYFYKGPNSNISALKASTVSQPLKSVVVAQKQSETIYKWMGECLYSNKTLFTNFKTLFTKIKWQVDLLIPILCYPVEVLFFNLEQLHSQLICLEFFVCLIWNKGRIIFQICTSSWSSIINGKDTLSLMC